jgi:hypothetical protein
MRSLKLFIAQQRDTFIGNIPVGLRGHNPKLRLEIDRLKLLFQRSDAFENDRESLAEAAKVGVKVLFRNASGSTVLAPNHRHRQFEHLFDACVSDDGAYWARRVDKSRHPIRTNFGKFSSQLDSLVAFKNFGRKVWAYAHENIPPKLGYCVHLAALPRISAS